MNTASTVLPYSKVADCYMCSKNSSSCSKLTARMMTPNLGICQLATAWRTAWIQTESPWPQQTQLFLTATKAFRCSRRWVGREQVLAEMKMVSLLHPVRVWHRAATLPWLLSISCQHVIHASSQPCITARIKRCRHIGLQHHSRHPVHPP